VQPAAQQANPGDILLGKYRVEEVIGIGGMGRVVKASHLYLQQPVAIKILLSNMAESQSTVARFLREAQATVKLRSEHIARVMDVGTLPDGVPFMVMEYLQGHDLNQILRHHGPQMPQAVVDLMLQACEAIAEAHALGIVHRDIKPSNFFVTHRPDGSNLLKILDFGISKTPAEISELTGTQTVIGTPTYMAPEQMKTARGTDPRSDIWSMGVVMYQLLAGRPPFEAESYAALVLMVSNDPPAPLHVPIPAGLKDIVWRCLEKDPKNRIQNVGELARMLAPYASDPLSAQQSADRAMRILAARNSQPVYPQLAGLNMGNGLTPPPALTPKSWNHTNGSSLSAGVGQVGTQVVRGGRGKVIAAVAGLCIAAGTAGFLIASSRKPPGDGSTHVAAPPTEVKAATTPATTDTKPTTAADTKTTDTGAATGDTKATDAKAGDVKAGDAKATDTKAADAKASEAKAGDAKAADTQAAAAKAGDAKADTKAADPHAAAKTDTKATAAKTDAAKSPTTAKVDTSKTTGKATTKSSTSKTTSSKTATKTKSSKSKDDDLFDDRH
jgi:serine/threonine-protein kinase